MALQLGKKVRCRIEPLVISIAQLAGFAGSIFSGLFVRNGVAQGVMKGGRLMTTTGRFPKVCHDY